MGATGFEPVKAEPADLQSAPFGHLGTRPYFAVHLLLVTGGENIRSNRACMQGTLVLSHPQFCITSSDRARTAANTLVGGSGLIRCRHHQANGEDAALVGAIGRTPLGGAQCFFGDDAQPAQQQVGNGHDQQQPVKAIGFGDLSVTQALAVEFAFMISEQLLDSHTFAIEIAELVSCVFLVGHQKPTLVCFCGQVFSPANDYILRDQAVAAIADAFEHFGDTLFYR